MQIPYASVLQHFDHREVIAATMKLNTSAIRYLTNDDWRVLAAVRKVQHHTILQATAG